MYPVVESRLENPEIWSLFTAVNILDLVLAVQTSCPSWHAVDMIGVHSSPAQSQISWLFSFGQMLVVEREEKVLIDFKAGLCDVEDEGDRNELEYINFIPLAIIIEVFEEVFLVGEFMVILEMIEGLFEDAIIDAVLVFIVFIALLPSQVNEHLLVGFNRHPSCASGHYTMNQTRIIAMSDVVFEGLL